jgi:hypothetical protein
VIFARYIGPEAPNWTKGKIYFAMPGFEQQTAVDAEDIRLQDDDSTWQEIKTEARLFVFPSCVHAVCLKPLGSLVKGEVVRVCNMSDEFFSVDGHGYLQADHFEILDWTNVAVGNTVREVSTGHWKKITRLDEAVNLCLSDAPDGMQGSELHAPTYFVFPVGSDGILAEPILTCIKPEAGELTVGRSYSPLQEEEGLVTVVNDLGEEKQYMMERFV